MLTLIAFNHRQKLLTQRKLCFKILWMNKFQKLFQNNSARTNHQYMLYEKLD